MSQIFDIPLRMNSSFENILKTQFPLERKFYAILEEDIPVLEDIDRHSIAITATILFILAIGLNVFALLTFFKR